jgi:hypothetical protein
MLNNNQQTPQVCWVLMHVDLHFYLRKGNCGPHGDQCVHMHACWTGKGIWYWPDHHYFFLSEDIKSTRKEKNTEPIMFVSLASGKIAESFMAFAERVGLLH